MANVNKENTPNNEKPPSDVYKHINDKKKLKEDKITAKCYIWHELLSYKVQPDAPLIWKLFLPALAFSAYLTENYENQR